MTVELDTRELERAVRSLTRGLDARTGPAASATASEVAGRIRSATPVRTGRLRSTISVTSTREGASVHYGGSLPYADYIDGRTNAVADGIAGAPDSFAGRMHALAASEVARL